MNKFIIYKVLNTFSDEIYIGATKCDLEKRKQDHIQKAHKKVGSTFQEAICTYGPDAFVWESIDTANTSNELANKESYYILQYHAKENGYNSDRGGGIKKNVYQYDINNGNLLNAYTDLGSAGNAVSAHKTSISKACLGEIKNCKGFFWSYSLRDNYKPEEDERNKKVFQFTLNGEYMCYFGSVAEASNKTGINRSSIAKCCRGKYKYAGNFYWKYQK